MSSPPEGTAGSVIHDLGYRRYDGPRLPVAAIARSLFITGLLNAYGIGRSGKSKALPMTLLAIMLVPALIMVAIMVLVSFGEGFVDYFTYSNTMMFLIVVYAAAQAPVLFSRDLRSGSIALYLARPLGATGYALTRLASLFAAIALFICAPLVALYIGALSTGDANFWEHTKDVAAAILGAILLAALLAVISGVLSAYTLRRGLAVGISIVGLLVTTLVVTAFQAGFALNNQDLGAQIAGLFSPFTLAFGVQSSLLGGTDFIDAEPQGAMVVLYLLAAIGYVVGGTALLVSRYRRQAGR